MNYSLSYSMSMLFLMWTWVLEVASNASKSAKFGFCLKNWPINMCIVLVFLKLRIRVKVAVVLGVLDEDVLLHPGDDFEGFRNPKIWILLEKLAYTYVHYAGIPIIEE